MGMGLDDLDSVCDQASDAGVVCACNINCPGQIVISGAAGAVNKAIELAKDAGAKRAILLPVSAPFHCALMKPAEEKLAEVLNETDFNDLNIHLVNNADAQILKNGNDVRQSLIKQVVSPVRWEESVNVLLDEGVDHFLEVGTGKVLTGFINRIDRNVEKHSVSDVESYNNYLGR